jgi:beta-glucanase (GH16 family)
VTQFHTYSAKWTEKTVTFYIDGKKTKEIQQSPQYPMQLMLGIYEIPEMIKNKSRQKYPNEFVIDFVKVYQDK